MRLATFAATIALAAVTGCAQPELPRDHFFRLMVATPAAPPAAPILPGVLEVPRLSADGLVSERPLVYSFRDDPQALRQYNYNLWNDAPPAILQDQLAGYLRAANVARLVVTPTMRQRPDHQVVGRVRRFEQVVGPPHGVAVEIELGLLRLKDDRLVLLKTYREERATPDETPATAAQAISQAMADLFARFVKDIEALKVR